MDCTGSMVTYVQEAKRMMGELVAKYVEKHSKDSLLFAFVGYRDHGDSKVCESLPLSTYNVLKPKISEIKLLGGFDHCEAVVDGLYKACRVKFRSRSIRFVFLIGDSPPHGRQFH
jgi:hypothetical protein